MFGDWIRRMAFWGLDALHGGEIRRNYRDIKKKMGTGELNTKRLNVLLRHAVEEAPFYKDCNPEDFYSFPVIDKNTIKNHWQELHAKNYVGEPLHHMSTSGSTGTPFVMEWDMGKRKRQMAELIYFNEISGQKLGQPFMCSECGQIKIKNPEKSFLCRIFGQLIFCI